jgi:LmbE family N-acetylglucosaminyl deacetylase
MNGPFVLLGRTLVLVAHPDDETVGCGALLQRMREPVVVFCTDGAPRDEYFWREHGSRLRYGRLRQEEARRSLAAAGVTEMEFIEGQASGLDLFVDQELYRAIPEAVAVLTSIVERYRPQAVLTLAYEGGHPDHDTCSFLGAVVGRRYALPVWEFPLYHRQHGLAMCAAVHGRAGELVYQRFVVPGAHEEIVLELTPDELEKKRTMLAQYSSQHPFLFEFEPSLERLRPQHAYDYSQPPHVGPLNYEAWQWGIRARDVCDAFTAFLKEQRRQLV